MPVELVNGKNLDLAYPPFVEKLLDLLASCRKRGADYYVSQLTRTWPEQAALYAQGRTQPGKKVTDAPPGRSAHNFGIGVDVVRDSNTAQPKLQADWDPKHYDIWQEELTKVGFKRGPAWDHGHAELDLSAHGLTLDALKPVYLRRSQLTDVWTYLNTHGF